MNEKAMLQVSIVVVSYHTGPVLFRALEAALVQQDLAEILLVDNGNPPEIQRDLDQLAERQPKLKILRGQGNVGFARGCNIGAERATGAYILLLNPDCLLPPGALRDAVAIMVAHPKAWLAGARMMRPDGQPQGGSKRQLLSPNVALSQALRLYRLWPNRFTSLNLPETSGEVQPQKVPAISGAFMLIQKERYQSLGGLDERYFFHVEDLDLCRVIGERGGEVLYIPQLEVTHYQSTSAVSSLFVERHKTDGFVRYFHKHRRALCPYGMYYAMVAAIWLRMMLRLPGLAYARWRAKGRKQQAAVIHARQQHVLHTPPIAHAMLEGVRLEALQQAGPVILAGSTGQVGLSIMARLLEQKIPTIALYNQTVLHYQHPELRWVQGNLQTQHLPGEITAKTLVHTPAIWFLPQNLEAFAAMGVRRLICFSSTSIEGKAGSKNAYERELIRKFTQAEKDVRQECDRLGIAVTIFRPTLIYGTGLDRNISSIVRVLQRIGFFPVTPPGAGLRQPVHVDDLAASVMRALVTEEMHGQTYNLAGEEQLTYCAMVNRLSGLLGKGNRALPLPGLPLAMDVVSILTRRGDLNGEIARRMNRDLVFDYTKATQEFGYRPREFLSAGLKDLGMESVS